MEINVKNMPLDTVYRFDTNKYVMATMLKETRDGNYPLNEEKRFTEVYQIDNDGALNRIASGTLIDDPDVYDFNHEFAIRDYDKEMSVSFNVTMHLQEVGLDELYELRAAIEKNYNKNKK